MSVLISALASHAGRYAGVGINHENQEFAGAFTLTKILNVRGLQIEFAAHSIDGAVVFHKELSTIAPNASGGISLFNLNSNTPFLSEHLLVVDETKDGARSLTFRFGDVENKNAFREEVRLELLNAGRIGYHYSWGLPGGDFAYRSGAVMKLAD